MNIFERRKQIERKTIINLSTSKSLTTSQGILTLELLFFRHDIFNINEECFYKIKKEDVARYFPILRDSNITDFNVITTEVSFGADQVTLLKVTYEATNNAYYNKRFFTSELGRIPYEYI